MKIYVVCQHCRGTTLLLMGFIKREDATCYLKRMKEKDGFYNIQLVDVDDNVS